MIRSTLNMAGVFLVGFALTTAALMLGFFASPEAVRPPQPEVYNSLLLEMLVKR